MAVQGGVNGENQTVIKNRLWAIFIEFAESFLGFIMNAGFPFMSVQL
ncbi:hypothetical protein GCM10011450_12570 [Advenella faeciporci]|uniref:Uncharacterized protein n=1 Tax=Advenella faeciporci TaxID=797535 RepID=A0A918JJZ1_9BURK|nr:hypothetical protein GCM10011450_12570 [Advenella faeciporci]